MYYILTYIKVKTTTSRLPWLVTCHVVRRHWLTHRGFDVGVGVRELWEVAGNVRRVHALLSCRQRFRSHGGVGHWS